MSWWSDSRWRLSWHWRFGCFTVDLLCRCCVFSWGCRGILLPHSGDARQRGLRPHDPHGDGHGRLFRHGSVFHHRSDWGEQGLYCIGTSSCSSLRGAVNKFNFTSYTGYKHRRWCHRCMCFPHETPVSVLWHLPTPGMRRTRKVEQFSLSNGNANNKIFILLRIQTIAFTQGEGMNNNAWKLVCLKMTAWENVFPCGCWDVPLELYLEFCLNTHQFRRVLHVFLSPHPWPVFPLMSFPQ